MKRQYRFSGIDCANCARKIEDLINKIEGIDSASVNFLMQKITIDAEDITPEIKNEILKAARKIERDAQIAF